MRLPRIPKILFALAVLVVSGFSFLSSLDTALAADAFCPAISGQNVTEPVGEGADLNEGVFDFNAVFADAYKGCVEASFLAPPTEYDLDGWAWNTNLGWTALSARGTAAPYESAGLPVGDFEFRSYVKGNDLRGWWWNDAMGWISLNCMDLGICGASNYGGIVAANGAVSGYAWSDSLGWINLAGIQFPPLADLYVEPEVTLTMLPGRGDGSFYPSLEQPVYAKTDNTVYRVAVGFNYNGQSLIDDYDFDFELNWRDQLMSRQVRENANPALGEEAFEILEPPADRGNTSTLLLSNKSSVSKTYSGGNKVNGFTEGGTSNFLKATVNGKRMYVSRNGLLAQVPSTYFGEGELNSLLEIKNLTVAIKDPDSGQVSVIPTPYEINRPIIFNPPVSTLITQRDQESGLSFRLGENDPVDAVWELEDGLSALSGAVGHLVLFEPPTTASDYIFCLLESGSARDACEPNQDPENLEPEVTGYDSVAGSLNDFPGTLDVLVRSKALDEGQQLDSFEVSENTGLYGYVSYRDSFGEVNYITGDLRTSNFQVFDALITGTTRVDAFRSLTDDQQTQPSLGVKSERNRESFLKFSQELLRGKRIAPTYAQTCLGAGAINLARCQVFGLPSTIEAYSVQTSSDIVVPPAQFNLQMANREADAIFVVAVGRDLIINRDVFFAAGDQTLDKSKSLVIMAFKNGNGLGGNIYIDNDVTMLQANIYADGSLFSVGDGWTYNAGQLPYRDTVARTSLKNQFVLYGNLVSQNTIGGCDLNPPRLGNGTISRLPLFQAREEACLYDLNYFRYSPYVPAINDILEWPEDTNRYKLAAALVREPGQSLAEATARMRTFLRRTVDNPGQYSLVNLLYKAPPVIEGLPALPTGFTFSN